MAFSKTNVTLEILTPALAAKVAEMPGTPGERPLKAKRVSDLYALLRTGRFASPTWAIVVDSTTGQRYRANGQHSSAMLAKLPPEEFPTGLLVTIEEYTTDNFVQDAFDIFEIFDNPRSARNNTDKMGTFRVQYPDLLTIKLEMLVAVANGVYHYEEEREGGVPLTARMRGGYFKRPEVRAFALWTAGFENARHGWMLKRSSIVGQMFATVLADKPTAEEFWRLVMTASHPDPDHETRELADTLKDLDSRPRIKQSSYERAVIKCWKRYRRIVTPQSAAA